jgi:hypothetical protein
VPGNFGFGTLARFVQSADLSVAEWRRIRHYRPRSQLGLAWKCLYLNRTSFSGILNDTAGPIGGPKQAGKYRIDARFPRERLAARILKLSALSGRVVWVAQRDWRETLSDPFMGRGRKSDRVPSQRMLEIEGGASGWVTVVPQAARSIMLLAGG